MYYTYILRCEKGTLYTGITTDVQRRFQEHLSKSGVGAKYTRANSPVEIVSVWVSSDRSKATKLECFIKTLTKSQKLELISSPDVTLKKYSHKINAEDYILQKIK